MSQRRYEVPGILVIGFRLGRGISKLILFFLTYQYLCMGHPVHKASDLQYMRNKVIRP